MTRFLPTILMLMLAFQASAGDIVGAASEDHVWFATVEPGATGRVRLYHHAVDMGGAYYRSPMTLVESPSAMAAAGDQAWIIFDPNPRDATPRREVYTIHARRNPATGWYFYEPEGALAPLPQLPPSGMLAGAASTDEGLAVLLMPRRRGPGDHARGTSEDISEPRLLILKGAAWISEPLPDIMRQARLALLTSVATGTHDRSPAIVAVLGVTGESIGGNPGDRGLPMVLLIHEGEGRWRVGRLTEGSATDADLLRGAGVGGMGVPAVLATSRGRAILGLLTGEGSPTRDEVRLGLIRTPRQEPASSGHQPFKTGAGESAGGSDGGRSIIDDQPAAAGLFCEWLPLVTLPPPHSKRLVVGTRRGLLAIERRTGDQIVLRVIDSLLGTVGEPRPMAVQPLSAAGRVYLPILLTALTATMLVVILVRPAAPGECRLPEGSRPADLTRRAAALALDTAPCLALAMLLTGSGVTTLGNFPLWAPTAAEAWPLILAAAMLTTHSVVSEALWGRTIGKALLGLRVTRVTGERAGPGRLFVRNLVKAVVLLLPPLMILVLLNAYRQQLGDIVAGTVVVENAPELRETG